MKTTVRTPFEDLVKQAVEAEFVLRDLETPARRRLSAKAFRAEAIANARTTPEKVGALRRAIEANPEAFPHTRRFLDRAMGAIREAHLPGPFPNASHRYLGVLGADAALPELVGAGSHVLEAFVLAVEDSMEHQETHEVVGTAASTEGWKRDHAAAQERRDALRQRIGKEYTAADVTHGDFRPDGSVVPVFRLSGGAVSLAPLDSAGERLVNWATGQADVLRALGVQVP